MKDYQKLLALAHGLGDKVVTRGASMYVPAWGRKFVFNGDGEIVDIRTRKGDDQKGHKMFVSEVQGRD